MTAEIPTEPAREILGRLHPGAQFTRVPSWVGGSEVLIASVDDGCVAIAPPATALSPSDTPEALAEWRVGWFAADEEGVDLDAGPATQASAQLRELLPLEPLSEAHPFLYASHVANVRHYALVRDRLAGDAATRADAKLSALEAEWSALFPAEPWPLTAEDQTSPGPLAELFAASGQRLVAMLFPQPGGFAGVHGSGSTQPEGGEQADSIRFGPGIRLVAGAAENYVELVVDFDTVLRTHPEIGDAGFAVHLVDTPGHLVGSVECESPSSPCRVRVDVGKPAVVGTLRLAVTSLGTREPY